MSISTLKPQQGRKQKENRDNPHREAHQVFKVFSSKEKERMVQTQITKNKDRTFQFLKRHPLSYPSPTYKENLGISLVVQWLRL